MARIALLLTIVVACYCTSSFGATIKINPKLVKSLESNGKANAVVSFDGTKKPLSGVSTLSFASRGAKITYIKDVLAAHAKNTQAKVLSTMESLGLNHKSYWINNKIFVKDATLAQLEKIASFPEVSDIREEKILHIIEGLDGRVAENTINAEWGISNINAPEAWAMGYKGSGSVVGIIDTGARFTHEALGSWRADYGWFDPYNGIEQPNDLVGHGTHVAGTIAGSEESGIGVAPEAQFVACKGCSTSSCTEEALVGCGMFMVCPTLPDGTAEDCSKAPHLVSNSWGGGQGDPFYNDVIAAWQEAGLIPVFANGNSGPNCATANSPGDQDNVIAVGSTTASNGCSSFSSKGPAVQPGGSTSMKPDVCAPGSDIRSSYHLGDKSYYIMSGTSMATPHVSGTIAVMLSANPFLTYAEVYDILTSTTEKDLQTTTVVCDDTTVFPNEAYGHGKVDVVGVVQAALKLKK